MLSVRWTLGGRVDHAEPDQAHGDWYLATTGAVLRSLISTVELQFTGQACDPARVNEPRSRPGRIGFRISATGSAGLDWPMLDAMWDMD